MPNAPQTLRRSVVDPVAEALRCLRAGRLRLALQPVRPADRLDGLAFHEALARIETADGALLSAATFVGGLEAQGHAPRLDRAALRLALAMLSRDRAARIAVNVSARTIGDRGWMAILTDAARRDRDAARRLVVELTETAFAAPTAAAAFRRAVGAAGPAFALDDFGTGFATEAQAVALRPDILKLDARHADGLRRGGAAALFAALGVRRAVAVAARCGEALVVAEGVRGPAEAAILARLGAGAVQGYGLGEPALAAA